MRTSIILDKLDNLDRSIGIEPESKIRKIVTETREHLLLLERERVPAYAAIQERIGFRKLLAHIYGPQGQLRQRLQ